MKIQLYALPVIVAVSLTTPAWSAPVRNPGNGHYYELIQTQLPWASAITNAASLQFAGASGHLATITSAAENAFIRDTFATGQPAYFAWIGGYEPNDNGVWIWGAGPEVNTQFSTFGSATPPFNFVAWQGVEPNDFGFGEDFAAINLGATFAGVGPGGWIDSPNPNPSDPIRGLIVEYEAPSSVPTARPGARALFVLVMTAMGAVAARRSVESHFPNGHSGRL